MREQRHPHEFLKLDAVGQAEAIARGDLCAAEAAQLSASACEQRSRLLNFVDTPLFERPVRRDGAGTERGLAGVSMLMKDFLATIRGVPHREGSRFLRNHVAAENSELTDRILAAGLQIVGTSTTPEFALMSTTESALSGPTRNPWDAERIAGGSSGGSAAAVASGAVALAHGNDCAGSLRIPASCCGVVGFKPSRGVNPLSPYSDPTGLWAEHVLTRSVRDSAAALEITASADTGALGELERGPGNQRIAFTTSAPNGAPVNPEVASAASEAACVLAKLGHMVEEGDPIFPVSDAEGAVFGLLGAIAAARIDEWSDILGRGPHPAELEPLTHWMAEESRRVSGPDMLRRVSFLMNVARRVDAFLYQYDFWLTPTLADLPPKLGYFQPPPDRPWKSVERDEGFAPFGWIANVLGGPAISLPTAGSAQGLPIGVHLMARPGRDLDLLRLARQIEEALPWASRLAALHDRIATET